MGKNTRGGMNRLREMIKRRKDEGFTLIELMIVIAVIGILAIVLVPRVGTIKTQARTSGLDTNIRMVQGYVQSRISSWSDPSTPKAAAAVATEVYGAVASPTLSDPMRNPLDNTKAAFNSTDGGAGTVAGEVYITSTPNAGPVNQVVITALDSTGAVYKTVTITP